jgi:nickel-dependent lactate racemase
MPLDLTFYQTIKGITAVQHIVKPGGKILIVSECSEGIGSPEFSEKLRNYKGAQSFLDEISDTPVVPDQWQLEKLALVALKHPLSFYAPGTRPQQLGALGAQSFANLQDAVNDLVSGLPPDGRVAIIPDGPYAFARVALTA